MNQAKETKSCKLCRNEFVTTNRSKQYCDSCNKLERGKLNHKILAERNCDYCNEPFIPKSKVHRICTDACRLLEYYKSQKVNLPLRPCDECGTMFPPKNKNSRFCTGDCRKLANLEASKIRRKNPAVVVPDTHLAGSTSKKCKHCGKEFLPDSGSVKYCSDCPPAARNKLPPILLKCENCGEEFLRGVGTQRRVKAKFCPECKSLGRKVIKASPRDCKKCRNSFRPCWERSDAQLCSRECQGLWINAQGLGPRHNDEELLAILVAVIKKHEECLSQDDLMRESGTSASTWKARGWTMEFLYRSAGLTYDDPVLNSRFEDRVYSVLREIIPDMAIETDKLLPEMYGFKMGELRADIFIKGLNMIVEADGKQHLNGRGDLDKLDYIIANDRLKDEYAACSGITLIRIPQTVDRRLIKARLLRGVRSSRPGFRPLNPSNALNAPGSARRLPKRRDVSSRPNKKRGEKGPPLEDVYCRGCHARPSFEKGHTFLCADCWDRSKELGRSVRALQADEVPALKQEIVEFVKGRGRYVWQPEVYLHLRQVSGTDLKKHNIKVAPICRELGFYAPSDDRITQENAHRIRDFVTHYMETHNKTPKVHEVLAGAGVDHDTLWACMDYEAYIASLGGKINTEVRHRFRNAEEFLTAAAEIVRKAGCRMRMTAILEELGVSYPAYLEHFEAVRPEMIHEAAGVGYRGFTCGEPQGRPNKR